LKGLGPKAAGILAGLGVTRFEQIAAWNDADIAAIDAQMGAFAGRITRDRWVDQAKLLASGDTAAFEAEFGALGR
jgi:predicted flap endonuclease-1-like 5' DNA nuclease